MEMTAPKKQFRRQPLNVTLNPLVLAFSEIVADQRKQTMSEYTEDALVLALRDAGVNPYTGQPLNPPKQPSLLDLAAQQAAELLKQPPPPPRATHKSARTE